LTIFGLGGRVVFWSFIEVWWLLLE